jgi:hypothetical protein
MTADNATAESVDVITDALLTASRLLVAVSARSIALVDETISIPQFRTLVILSNRGRVNLATLAGWLGVGPVAHRSDGRPAGERRADRPPSTSPFPPRAGGRADRTWA